MMNSQIDIDAQNLRDAMKGFGTDEATIIKIVANRTNAQRQQIKESFSRQFNRDLIKDIKSEFHGKMEDVIVSLFDDPYTYDAKALRDAVKGAGTNEDALIEIICTRTNSHLANVKEAYNKLYNRDLIADIKSDVHGYFEDVLVSILNLSRSDNLYPNENYCQVKARELYDAGANKIGTDEKKFIEILTQCSCAELQLIALEYGKIAGVSIKKSIEKETSGKLKKALKTIILASLDPHEYFATRVYEAIHGSGTKDRLLMRILVTRDEVDMPEIKKAFLRLYDKDMVTYIKSDLGGDYKKLMIELCDH